MSKNKHEKECLEESKNIMIKTIYSNTDASPRSGIYCPFNFEKQSSLLMVIFEEFFKVFEENRNGNQKLEHLKKIKKLSQEMKPWPEHSYCSLYTELEHFLERILYDW